MPTEKEGTLPTYPLLPGLPTWPTPGHCNSRSSPLPSPLGTYAVGPELPPKPWSQNSLLVPGEPSQRPSEPIPPPPPKPVPYGRESIFCCVSTCTYVIVVTICKMTSQSGDDDVFSWGGITKYKCYPSGDGEGGNICLWFYTSRLSNLPRRVFHIIRYYKHDLRIHSSSKSSSVSFKYRMGWYITVRWRSYDR